MHIQLPVAEEARRESDQIDSAAIALFLAEFAEVIAIAKPEVAVLIPAFNEADALPKVHANLPTTVGGKIAVCILLIDGATDGTEEVARSLNMLTCTAPVNRGQGSALKMGYKLVSKLGLPYICVIDADGQWDPLDLDAMVLPLESGVADFVQGSRVLGRSEVGDPVRDLGVIVFARVISLLTHKHVTDTSSGIRGFRTSLLEEIRLSEPQYQSSELLISAAFAGARIVEHPVVMKKRKKGTSKKGNNVKYGLNYSRVVLQTWIRERFILR